MKFLIRYAKTFILWCLLPLERRGIAFTMRCKNAPPEICRDIREMGKRSFCPWAHFECAWRALRYIDRSRIPGDVVLCGVATGGLAKFLLKHLPPGRKLWLYDMFDGGTLPGEKDSAHDRRIGESVKRIMSTNYWEVAEYVEGDARFDAMRSKCQWVVGDVMQTIPAKAPPAIALLYLDTDWHDSTRHELKHLEPRVMRGGVIIQDDMGLCVGAKRAVLEYYEDYENDPIGPETPLFIPMSEAGCIWVKK